jgi:hypothetical protein
MVFSSKRPSNQMVKVVEVVNDNRQPRDNQSDKIKV